MKSTVLMLPAFLVTGLETLPTFRPDAPVFFALKKTGASGQNVGKVSNPVTKKPVTREPSITSINEHISPKFRKVKIEKSQNVHEKLPELASTQLANSKNIGVSLTPKII